ncbi:uncharacterized protein LOC117785481 [Drosophila innubila]|uniref:uncharacterized protein LOC117785481 n=1 Tax=Drosophila innubila TaxID=198719 RepID=UPI00148DF7A1|nr:uncharacterized protein LOC117785481 [Drosophila innubila]
MIFRRCCFCVPLRRASMTIGTIFMSFFFIEMAIHGQQSFFISSKGNSWDIVQAIILTSGIIASILLIHGSYKENRCLVLVWVIVFLIIFISYVILTVVDVLFYQTRTIILIIEGCILVIMLYSLMVVHSYYDDLLKASTDAVQI